MSIYGYGYMNEKYLDQINISPKQISSIFELNEEIVTNENGIDDFLWRTNTIFFEKFGLGLSRSMGDIKDCIANCIDIVKTNGVGKQSTDKISLAIEDLVQSMAENINVESMIKEYPELGKYDKAKIIQSIILTIHVCVCNTIAMYILIALSGFNVIVGQALSAVIVAPINEEMGKRIAIKGGFQAEYQVVFNIVEASQYILTMMGPGIVGNPFAKKISFIQALKVRIFPILMHITTTIVQFLTQNKAIQTKIGLTKPEDKAKLSNLGYLIGMLIHGTWNFLAVINDSWLNKFISRFAGLN